jgi:hypothetical protein
MNWLEAIFGISPDGGDGSTETMLLVAGVSVLAVLLLGRISKVRRWFRHVADS